MKKARIYYARMDEFWRKEEKLRHLEKLEHLRNVDWQEIKPNQKHTWLTDGLEDDFTNFIQIGDKRYKSLSIELVRSIFHIFSHGNDSGRDDWVYNFRKQDVIHNSQKFAEVYNSEVERWHRSPKDISLDNFLISDETKIKWTRNAKRDLRIGHQIEFCESSVRQCLYRPFILKFLFTGKIFNKEIALFPSIFPIPETEKENQVICLPGIGNRKTFGVFISRLILSLDFAFEKAQCFPFYTYDENGSNRKENITDWALAQFQSHYQDPSITKWDIFHYAYAVLHHPHYRTRYAANLKREFPRIPFAPDFRPFATVGQYLADIHVHYEDQPEYRLKHQENKDLPIDWRVEKMRLSKDKTQLKYNDFLTLTGIPPEVFEYRLGNRSALDWVINQYRIKTDKRSGITNDPNRLDDEQYIVRLIKKVITVSLETVKIVNGLPDLGLPKD
ncbi:MAG: helicase [Cyanothece sp. SIO2G6]|nr:helicase [Cyanothece sp. SIO2G6]